MKSKKSERMNDLIQAVGKLAKIHNQLARQAERQYTLQLEAVLKAKSRDSKRIEHLLDCMLDFCFDPQMLLLYKKLCRYYFKIDPEATASYVYAYRETWDEKDQEN